MVVAAVAVGVGTWAIVRVGKPRGFDDKHRQRILLLVVVAVALAAMLPWRRLRAMA